MPWICVGHESELSSPGCWFLFKLANESIIVSRDNEGRVRAFYNVCPHRGSTICVESKRHSKRFVCPYHAWTFNLEWQAEGCCGSATRLR
jgi:phenylpropionate dioxygenase-like ring-hydroxylating dioxygenase large terminal subunit